MHETYLFMRNSSVSRPDFVMVCRAKKGFAVEENTGSVQGICLGDDVATNTG